MWSVKLVWISALSNVLVTIPPLPVSASVHSAFISSQNACIYVQVHVPSSGYIVYSDTWDRHEWYIYYYTVYI